MIHPRRLLLAAGLALAGTQAAGHGLEDGFAQRMTLRDLLSSRPRPDVPAYFGEHRLRDQDGRELRFYADLLAGRTVLLNAVATQCGGGYCLPKTRRLADARALLGSRFGTDIFFVTLTTDPARDTASVLKSFAQREHVDVPGWRFVTGEPAPLGSALHQLGYALAEMHASAGELVLGNTRSDRWRRLRGDAAPRVIADALLELARPRTG